jgi:type IV pilus assembly protein PilB
MSQLIEYLVSEKMITEEQLRDALAKQMGAKSPIHDVLIEMGFVKEEDLLRIAAKVYNMPIVNLSEGNFDLSVLKYLPCDTAKRFGVFPIGKENDLLILAMSNPKDIIALDDLKCIAKMDIKPILSSKSQISACIAKYYQLDDSLYNVLKNITSETEVKIVPDDHRRVDTAELNSLTDGSSAVVKLVDLILNDAVKNRATDIHVEPQETQVEIRYRIDGYLKNIMEIPTHMLNKFVARIKILSDLDISETRKFQDGRMSVSFHERKIDIRISIIPTFYGEKIALRLLDSDIAKIEIDKIGLQDNDLVVFTEGANRPQGLILTTGPTGSGKTTTLYAALNYIRDETKNIMTIEDPIEYLMPGINQIQLNPAKDITFSSGLRSLLRQDPDVILVGEIRDKETAEIAFGASLTGHFVLSTLHTNNSIASVTRLLDIGLEPYLIASSIILIVSQRLVRLVCPHCKEKYTPYPKAVEKYKFYIEKFGITDFYRGRGCEKCSYMGFYGRIGIFEILRITDSIRNLIFTKASEDVIFQEARKQGFKTLAESGLEKVAQGITTLEEVEKVVDICKDGEVIDKSKSSNKAPTILVADDDTVNQMILKKHLSTAGYNVIEAHNGKEAVAQAVKEKPDIIIMDVTMPEMDGFEATKILRSQLETAVIPVIMLTAIEDKSSELKGIDIGADDYITKPFDKEKLLARVKMLLRRESQRKALVSP